MNKKATYLILALMLLLAVGRIRAQNADLLAAYNFVQQKQVDSAKARVDKAMKDPAVQKDCQAWYIRGFVYKTYYKEKESDNMSSPAREESVISFKKAIEIGGNEESVNGSKDNLKSTATRYYNDAAKSLDTINYKISIQNFEKYKDLIKFVEPSTNLTSKEIEFNMALATIYTNLYQVNQRARGNFLELAKATYNKVLIMDPNNVSANYSMGILYYNQAVYLIKGSDYDVDITSIDAIQDNQVQLFKQSLPLIEKAYSLDPKREETLIALSGIYFGLNDFEKSKLFQEKLDQMKKDQQNQH
jgi:tetratricopeptide (TPR) repeat protein